MPRGVGDERRRAPVTWPSAVVEVRGRSAGRSAQTRPGERRPAPPPRRPPAAALALRSSRRRRGSPRSRRRASLRAKRASSVTTSTAATRGARGRRRRCRARTRRRARGVARRRRPTSRRLAERGRLHRHQDDVLLRVHRADPLRRVQPGRSVSRHERRQGAERVACTRRSERQAGTRSGNDEDEREGSEAAAEARLGVRPRRADPQAGLLLATSTRTWIDGEKIPAERRLHRRVQPHLPRRPAHGGALRLRPRPAAALPGQVRPVQEQRCSASSSRAAGQIPVERLSRNAVGAYDAAVAAVRDGECVVVYPEGTITRDPDLWPMVGKSGAARIALETGCPVIPVGQWGAQELLAPYAKKPNLFPRKRITMKVGDPVDLERPGRPSRARAEVISRGHRPDHGRAHHAGRRPARRDRRRPSGSTRARPASADRQPQQEGGQTA